MILHKELPEGVLQITSIFELIRVNPKFENKHIPRYGGKLYIKSATSDLYEEYDFNENVTSAKIKKYIRTKQLYFLEKF